MIEWMQRHKKWLIVTIWISTIAFVGAGFVGWGSYDYGKSDSTVAIVGDKEVPLNDLQSEYSLQNVLLYIQILPSGKWYKTTILCNIEKNIHKDFSLT